MTDTEAHFAINAANAAVSQLKGRELPTDRLAVFGASEALPHAREIIAKLDGQSRLITLAARMFELGRRAGKAEAYAEQVREVCER